MKKLIAAFVLSIVALSCRSRGLSDPKINNLKIRLVRIKWASLALLDWLRGAQAQTLHYFRKYSALRFSRAIYLR